MMGSDIALLALVACVSASDRNDVQEIPKDSPMQASNSNSKYINEPDANAPRAPPPVQAQLLAITDLLPQGRPRRRMLKAPRANDLLPIAAEGFTTGGDDPLSTPGALHNVMPYTVSPVAGGVPGEVTETMNHPAPAVESHPFDIPEAIAPQPIRVPRPVARKRLVPLQFATARPVRPEDAEYNEDKRWLAGKASQNEIYPPRSPAPPRVELASDAPAPPAAQDSGDIRVPRPSDEQVEMPAPDSEFWPGPDTPRGPQIRTSDKRSRKQNAAHELDYEEGLKYVRRQQAKVPSPAVAQSPEKALAALLADAAKLADAGGTGGGSTTQLNMAELDLAPARGKGIKRMRAKGRICQRNVLQPEGPKYDRKGAVKRAAFRGAAGSFARTRAPRVLLPACCNCCKKSVLGCE